MDASPSKYDSMNQRRSASNLK
jgi:hypothetical protein